MKRSNTICSQAESTNRNLKSSTIRKKKKKAIDTDLVSKSCILNIEDIFSNIDKIITRMKAQCPFQEFDFFFTAYTNYKTNINQLLNISKQIFRKTSCSHSELCENIMQIHQTFLTSLSHLNLQKQPVYLSHIREYFNLLLTSFTSFLNKYRNEPQIKKIKSLTEQNVTSKITQTEKKVTSFILPIQFETLSYDQIKESIDELKDIKRIFEQIIKEIKARKLNIPNQIEFNTNIIEFIHILSNMPMFISNVKSLSNYIPYLSIEIENLCDEIENFYNENNEITECFVESLTKTQNDFEHFDDIISLAEKNMNIESNQQFTKMERLQNYIRKTEGKIESLKRELEEIKSQKEEENAKTKLINHFNDVRLKFGYISDKYEKEKEDLISTISIKLNDLLDEKFKIDQKSMTNGKEQFDVICKQLSNEINQLKQQKIKYIEENKQFRNEFQNLCLNISEENVNELNAKTPQELTHVITEVINKTKEIERLFQQKSKSIEENKQFRNEFQNLCSNISQKNINEIKNKTPQELTKIISDIINNKSKENEQFRSEFQNLCSNISQKNPNEIKNKTPQELTKIISDVINNKSKENEQLLQQQTKSFEENMQFRNEFQNLCSNISQKNPNEIKNKTPQELTKIISDVINNKSKENEQFRSEFQNLCSNISQKNPNDIRTKSPQELSYLIFEEINNAKKTDNKQNHANASEAEYTTKVIEPITQIISNLSSLLSSDEHAFLPTSEHFHEFLDALSQMKNKLSQVNYEKLQRPIHSLLMKSVELFNTLAISLSSASFAPEFQNNQNAIESLLNEHLSLNQSVAKLRILLEEKENLIQKEAAKLRKLKEKYNNLLQASNDENDF